MSRQINNLKSQPEPKRIVLVEDLATDAGKWLVLIGDGGESSADDIEAFFADIWPEVEPEATIQ